jgi:transposase InsO family protein
LEHGVTNERKLVTDALNMAIWQRQPKPSLVVHSDRGSQYASNAYRRLHFTLGYVSPMGYKAEVVEPRKAV